ncbi:hypothetical protein HYDPIDRAFT_104649 [Hydnomerulius pinastri MD-312]|nr:hypothetical protein HYDPIDRAFT_104649 [Hydnomerulius pinastri MD-312]
MALATLDNLLQRNGSEAAAAPPPLPPGLNAIAAIRPALIDIMIGHTFTVILIPLLIALFYFSNAHSRRQSIFILNVFTLCLAFAVGIMGDSRAINTTLSPTHPFPVSYDILMGVLGAVQSILVDIILLVRLISVHPYSHVGPKRFFLITALPITLKIGRFINLIMFVVALAKAANRPNPGAAFANLWLTAPYLKIEWFAQLIDNIYASTVFLWTLRARNKGRRGSVSINSKLSFTKRLQTLFWIAVSNFVFPALFSVAQIIVVYRAVDPVAINQICLANTSIAVIGVVFATVWAGSVKRRMDETYATAPQVESSEPKSKVGVIQFAPRHLLSDGTYTTSQTRSTYGESFFEMDQKTHSENFDSSGERQPEEA